MLLGIAILILAGYGHGKRQNGKWHVPGPISVISWISYPEHRFTVIFLPSNSSGLSKYYPFEYYARVMDKGQARVIPAYRWQLGRA